MIKKIPVNSNPVHDPESVELEAQIIEGDDETRRTAKEAMAAKLLEMETENPNLSDDALANAMGLRGIGADIRINALRQSSEYQTKIYGLQINAMNSVKELMPVMKAIAKDPEHPRAVEAFKSLLKVISDTRDQNTFNITLNHRRYEIQMIPQEWGPGPDGQPIHLPTVKRMGNNQNLSEECLSGGCQFARQKTEMGEIFRGSNK